LRKITFLDGDRLVELIDKHIPTFWTDVSLGIGEYLTALRLKTEAIDRNLSLLQVSDKGFYIEQDIYEFPRIDYRVHLDL
jgi:hypothetical protein